MGPECQRLLTNPEPVRDLRRSIRTGSDGRGSSPSSTQIAGAQTLAAAPVGGRRAYRGRRGSGEGRGRRGRRRRGSWYKRRLLGWLQSPAPPCSAPAPPGGCSGSIPSVWDEIGQGDGASTTRGGRRVRWCASFG